MKYYELYISKKLGVEEDEYGNEIPYFDKPKAYRFSYMPVSAQVDYQIYGALINQMYSSYLPLNMLGLFKSGDVAYMVNEEVQDVEELVLKDLDDKYCKNANYRVKIVQKQNFRIKVLFEQI